MAKQQIIVLGLWLAALCGGCWNRSGNKENKQDEFYTVTGGWSDLIRVPLLKPYEATKVDSRLETTIWTAEFFNSLGTYNIKRVAVHVQDSVVYILSGQVDEKKDSTLVNLRGVPTPGHIFGDSTLVNLQGVPTGWYAIDVKTKIEKGFSSEAEFMRYIEENNYPIPQWHNIDSLSEALGNKGKLPWMPNK